MMTRNDKIEALEGALELFDEGLSLIEGIACEDPNFEAYVYRQIEEGVRNENPYNQSIQSILDMLQNEESD